MRTIHKMIRKARIAWALFGLLLMSFYCNAQQSDTNGSQSKPTIILVHGAYADGSSWNKVIPILQKEGYPVIAVQNPLTSLDADVASVERVLSEVNGNVILVAHSWGGAVITQAGNNEKVKALVYVAAYAPDQGQSVDSINREAYDIRKLPNNRTKLLSVNTNGYLRLKEETIIAHFAQDLPIAEAKILAAVQGCFNVATVRGIITTPAWKTRPSFYVVADNDHIISPVLEAEMAKKIGAKVYHFPTSHVAMLARPVDVATVILTAAKVN